MNVKKQTEALKVIFNAVLKAQSKGVYTLEESSNIHRCLKMFFPKKPTLSNIEEENEEEKI